METRTQGDSQREKLLSPVSSFAQMESAQIESHQFDRRAQVDNCVICHIVSP